MLMKKFLIAACACIMALLPFTGNAQSPVFGTTVQLVASAPTSCQLGVLYQITPGNAGAGTIYGNSGTGTGCSVVATSGGPFLPTAGGTMTGPLSAPAGFFPHDKRPVNLLLLWRLDHTVRN